jgi:hypothetical protein
MFLLGVGPSIGTEENRIGARLLAGASLGAF